MRNAYISQDFLDQTAEASPRHRGGAWPRCSSDLQDDAVS